MTQYSERLKDIAVVHLKTEGFDKLTLKQKQLAYHLSEAGLWGKFITLDQNAECNIEFIGNLISLYSKLDNLSELSKKVHESLFILFAHNGIYHSTTGKKIELPLSIEDFDNVKELSEVKIIKKIWFESNLAQYQKVQAGDVDIIKESGGNFYKNLTLDEVQKYRKENYEQIEGDEIPPFGFNERLVKEGNDIISEVICLNGLYGNYIAKIIESLTKALYFTENDQQYKSINSLIKFYETGNAKDFDTHCVEWVKDKDGDIYFINGLIESYDDPLSIGCTFESIVAFKNPLQTEKVNKIIDNIQWFENNLPFDKKFKKEKALGLSASSINVISMAGSTSPTLPLGINLPNSDWIRKKHGSKSVNLENVSSSRSAYEIDLIKELYLEKYKDVLTKYSNLTNSLHTDLHEIAGHGSGKLLEGVSTDVIGMYYSVIEETRADLVALYFMADEKMKDFGILDNDVNVKEAALAQYVTYLTNGSMSQLRRVNVGDELTQAHLRNRQLIALWVLENSDKDKVSMINKNGKHYIEINDVDYVKEMFGKLLSKIQEIKSTGNFNEAKFLVEKYGTKTNEVIHKEIINRIEKLNMPQLVCFNTPILKQFDNDVIIEQSENFFEQQIDLFKNYNISKYQNVIKLRK
jgi:dipeptidyl-peptidase-3